MILVDANLLVYAQVSSLPQHQSGQIWLDTQLNGSASVGIPWPSLLGFIRLVSNPRVFEHPLTVAEAWTQAEQWLNCPTVWIPQPTDHHSHVLGSLLTTSTTRANLVPDAHLAALAIEHGLTLCSTDHDFSRFPGLQWENPLQSP